MIPRPKAFRVTRRARDLRALVLLSAAMMAAVAPRLACAETFGQASYDVKTDQLIVTMLCRCR
jgi:hypothetical protein